MRFPSVPLSVALLSLIFTTGCSRREPAVDLRTALEKAYASLGKACRDGDMSAYEKAVSSWHFGNTRNQYAATQREFTGERIKRTTEYLPDIANMTFVKTFRKGPTAGLLYRRETTEGGKISVEFTLIKFVQEKGAWRYHSAMSHTTDDAKAEFDIASLSAVFQIDGKVPVAPAETKPVEVVGLMDVMSSAYRTKVTVNGTEQSPIERTSSSGVILGGLRFGRNEIAITFEKLDESPFKPSVRVRAQLEGKRLKEVFSFAPENDVEGTHQKEFTVPMN